MSRSSTRPLSPHPAPLAALVSSRSPSLSRHSRLARSPARLVSSLLPSALRLPPLPLPFPLSPPSSPPPLPPPPPSRSPLASLAFPVPLVPLAYPLSSRSPKPLSSRLARSHCSLVSPNRSRLAH